MITWIEKTGQYESGYYGTIGRNIKIFSVGWDGVNGTKNNVPYILSCELHGFKTNLGGFETVKLAQNKAEIVLQLWIDKAGLKF